MTLSWHKFLSSVCFVITFTTLGTILGAFLATKVLPHAEEEWVALADMLGGLIVGALVSLPVGVVIAVVQPPRLLYIATVATMITIGALMSLAHILS